MPDKAKVAVFVSGTGTNLAALQYASRLPGAPYEIVLAASNVTDAGALDFAKAEGIPTFALSHRGMERAEHDAAMEAAALKTGAEYIALAGYMRVLSASFVKRWEGRMLNIHPSLLPKYRGLDTHRRAIDARDSHAGVSVHLVTEELDAGDVLGRLEVAVLPGDTPESLADRVRFAEHQLYPRVLGDYVSRIYDPGWLLSRVREMALAFPEAEERESHGAPGWRTGGKSGKFFAYLSDHHHGEDCVALLAKTSGQEELDALIERDPQAFYRPAFYGASGWVGIVLDRADVDWDQVEYWLQRSWRAVAPKRLTRFLDAADEF